MRERPRPFYGWTVVATAAVGLFFSAAPIIVYSFGVFLKPMADSFHVGRGAVSMAFMIHNVVSACCAPLVGYLIDRYGARRVVLPGLVALAAVLVSAELIGSRLWQLYAFYLALGATGVATGPVPYSAVTARWFDRRRGIALGLIMFGIGIGSTVVPPLAQHLIARLGWRSAYACWGVATLLIPLGLVSALLVDGPEKRGLLPDGAEAAGTEADRSGLRGLASAPVAPGMEWREIWRTRTFWLLITSFMLAGAAAHACVLHIAALLNDRGLSAQSAALGSAVVGLAVMLGRFGSGYLLDRIFGPRVAATLFGAAAMGILMLWTSHSAGSALAGAFFVGLSLGAEVDVVAFLMSRYFGLRSLGICVAAGFAGFVLAGGIGTFLMGAGFDATRSYTVPLAGFFVAMLIAAGLMTRLGPYRYAVMCLSEDVSMVKAGAA
ncbi:MAG TPA: MFS transporter [Acidobacteriaceae bacterium]|nr:MFS transporter [Acidobacteriaceae bacterium]